MKKLKKKRGGKAISKSTTNTSGKEEMFCQEYIIDMNARQSAIRAGYSEASCSTIAYELLKKPYIQDRIAQLNAKRMRRLKIDQDQVLAEWAKIAFSNIKDFMEEGDLAVKNLRNIPAMKAAAISSIKKITTSGVYEDGTPFKKTTVEYKMWDKLRALENVGKHIGFYEADNKQKANVPQFNELPVHKLSKQTQDALFEVGLMQLQAGMEMERNN